MQVSLLRKLELICICYLWFLSSNFPTYSFCFFNGCAVVNPNSKKRKKNYIKTYSLLSRYFIQFCDFHLHSYKLKKQIYYNFICFGYIYFLLLYS